MKKSLYLTGKILKGTTLQKVKLANVVPPHDVSLTEEHSKDILRSLKTNGWIQRPLLGYRFGKKIYCITGSHRIKVAKKLKRKTIPVFVLSFASLDHLRRLGFNGNGNQNDMLDFFYFGGVFSTSGKSRCPRHLLRYIGLDQRDKE